jgi:hypothetical protein
MVLPSCLDQFVYLMLMIGLVPTMLGWFGHDLWFCLAVWIDAHALWLMPTPGLTKALHLFDADDCFGANHGLIWP